MGRDISIVMSAKDQYSNVMLKMTEATRKFDKDAEGLQKKLNALDKTKVSLKLELDNAKKALKDAQKAFNDLDGAAKNDKGVRAAMENYDKVKRNFQYVTKEVRNTARAMEDLSTTQSKVKNRAGDSRGTSLAGLGEAGLTKLVGDSLSNAAVAGITSAMGSGAGNAVGNIISGAVSGAAIGSIIPGIGTAIGTGVGAIAGGINATSQNFTKKDEAFKSVVQGQFTTQQERLGTDINTGSDIAAQREMNMISFTTLLKDENVARDYLDWTIDTAARTPYKYEDLEAISKTLSAYQYAPEQMKDMLIKIGDAGGALSLDAASMDEVAQKLGFMKISDRATLKELNVLMQRGIPALDYLAEGYGVTTKEISKMITSSEVSGADASKMIVDAMGKAFSGSMQKQSLTYSGLQSTVDDLTMNQQNAYGEGYNQERKKGLTEQIDYLGDTSAREDVNRLIGEYQASLDNLHEQKIREAETEAYDFIQREHITGAEAGKILQEARIQAEADYMSSEGMQAELAMQKNLVDDIRDVMIADDVYKNFGYAMGKEFSKGMAESMWEDIYPNTAWVIGTTGRRADNSFAMAPGENAGQAASQQGMQSSGTAGRRIDNSFAFAGAAGAGKAYGMSYVPYNEYPAMLHEGEAVLTAQENRTYRERAAAPTVTLTGNSFVVREEADIYAIAREIASQVTRAGQLL